MDCTVFLESHWTKTFVRMARSDPSFYTSLFPESDLEYALSKAADDARSIKILDAHHPFRSLDRYADASLPTARVTHYGLMEFNGSRLS